MAAQDGILGPREVVLGKLADLVKEPRARLIVEVAPRQGLGLPRQSRGDRLDKDRQMLITLPRVQEMDDIPTSVRGRGGR